MVRLLFTYTLHEPRPQTVDNHEAAVEVTGHHYSTLLSALPVPAGTHTQQEADYDECDDQGRSAAQLQTRWRAVGTGDSCE